MLHACIGFCVVMRTDASRRYQVLLFSLATELLLLPALQLRRHRPCYFMPPGRAIVTHSLCSAKKLHSPADVLKWRGRKGCAHQAAAAAAPCRRCMSRVQCCRAPAVQGRRGSMQRRDGRQHSVMGALRCHRGPLLQLHGCAVVVQPTQAVIAPECTSSGAACAWEETSRVGEQGAGCAAAAVECASS